MLCYAMICFDVLCVGLLRYDMLRYAVICYDMLYFVLLAFAHATALISPRVVACAALFLHLQDGHCTEAVGAWQPFRVQERSARAT